MTHWPFFMSLFEIVDGLVSVDSPEFWREIMFLEWRLLRTLMLDYSAGLEDG